MAAKITLCNCYVVPLFIHLVSSTAFGTVSSTFLIYLALFQSCLSNYITIGFFSFLGYFIVLVRVTAILPLKSSLSASIRELSSNNMNVMEINDILMI